MRNLDKGRIENMVRCALDPEGDPRFQAVLVPAAERAQEPWEKFAYWLVHLEFPADAATVGDDRWNYMLMIARQVSLDDTYTPSWDAKLLQALFREKAQLARRAAIGQWPTRIPQRDDEASIELFRKIDNAYIAWIYAWSQDPATADLLKRCSKDRQIELPALKDKKLVEELARVLILAIAKHLIPFDWRRGCLELLPSLGKWCGHGWRMDAMIEESLTKFYRGYPTAALQELSRFTYGAATALGKRRVRLKYPDEAVKDCWIDGVRQSVFGIGLSIEDDLAIVEATDDPMVLYAVGHLHGRDEDYKPEDPFDAARCDRLSYEMHRRGITKQLPHRAQISFKQAEAFVEAHSR